MTDATAIEPVVATAGVHRPRAEAFELFTTAMGDWWPTRTHSVGGADVIELVVEPKLGGLIYERVAGGATHEWGRITVWQPPERFAVSWYVGRTSAEATDWECVFEEVDPLTTRVRLTHRGWERLADGADRRDEYEAGWPRVLASYSEHTAGVECIRYWAVAGNQAVWRLLDAQRTPEQDDEMVDAAHGSAWLWGKIGQPVNAARGDWLCAHVYTVLGRVEPAMHHARRSLATCEANGLGDFDLAYGHEGVARAAALAGDPERARKHFELASKAGSEIVDDEDRAIFDADLAAAPWFNFRP